MTIDTEKAKRALDALSQERQAQNDRLQLAAQAKQQLDNPYTHIVRFRLSKSVSG